LPATYHPPSGAAHQRVRPPQPPRSAQGLVLFLGGLGSCQVPANQGMGGGAHHEACRRSDGLCTWQRYYRRMTARCQTRRSCSMWRYRWRRIAVQEVREPFCHGSSAGSLQEGGFGTTSCWQLQIHNHWSAFRRPSFLGDRPSVHEEAGLYQVTFREHRRPAEHPH